MVLKNIKTFNLTITHEDMWLKNTILIAINIIIIQAFFQNVVIQIETHLQESKQGRPKNFTQPVVSKSQTSLIK